MIRSAPFLIAALILSICALSAKADQMDQRSGPMGMERMQHWVSTAPQRTATGAATFWASRVG